MLTSHPFLPLFQKFISASLHGKRLKVNGTRIKKQSIANYISCQKLLVEFSKEKSNNLVIYHIKGESKRDHRFLKKYYSKLYKEFTDFLYKERNCHDNYVGQTIKQIRTFHNWLNQEAGLSTGLYYKRLFVLRQEIPIFTLTFQQLRFLMWDVEFEKSLSVVLKRTKDLFVFGCLVGLRYSDLIRLRRCNLFIVDDKTYLRIKSQKTGAETSVKLPDIALSILSRYQLPRSILLPFTSLTGFNAHLKKIGELAGWTYPIINTRTKQGLFQLKQSATSTERFCDCMSSHMMRRTCITNMLSSGMPELIVKKISGHSNNSRSFFRYVNFAQNTLDNEIDKMHRKIE